MQAPDDNDRIRCPEKTDSQGKGEILRPEKVWDSIIPTGERVRYGLYRCHHHGATGPGKNDGKECPRSGLPAPEPVFPVNKKD